MKFLKHQSLENFNNDQSLYVDSATKTLGVGGKIDLFKNGDISSNKTSLKASTILSEDYSFTLPATPGLAGQILSTDGNGNLSFTNLDAGGNRIFVSAVNGNDENDGKILPVRTIKRAAQIAAGYSRPLVDPGQTAYDTESLLTVNKAYIAAEVIGYINYSVTNNISPFSSSFTYNQATCARDIGYIVEAVIYDLLFGGNSQSVYAGSSYYSATATTVISSQKAQSVAAINYAKYVSAAVLNNTAVVSNGTFTHAPYQTVVHQSIDGTKSPSSGNKSAIASSYDIITNILNNGIGSAPSLVAPQYIPTPVTIQIASGDYTEQNPIICPDKTTLVGDDLRSVIIRPANPNKDMFRVRNGMYMTGFTFRDALDSNGVPVSTWNYAIAFDDVNDFTVDRAAYTRLSPSIPIVTLSPYIQNCSIISFLGGNGALVDGSKVKTPNVSPIPQEEENPAVSSIPQQGKSMVANAFTMVSFGGTGWRIINDAYAQLVSCFQIFMLNGVLCESGGYCSITNSATNFGVNALRAIGYSPSTFLFDRGIITLSGYSNGSEQTITSIGHGRAAVNHYVVKIKDNSFNDVTYNYKSSPNIVLSFNAATAINTSLSKITINSHGLTNKQSIRYDSNSNSDILGLNSGDIYYVSYIDENSFYLYYDVSLTKKVMLTTVGSGTQNLIENNEEIYVNEITDSHNAYQSLILTSGSYTFTPGLMITGTVGSKTTQAYVYTWNNSTFELVVSLSNVIDNGLSTKIYFTNTSIIQADHAGSPNTNIAISSVTNLTNLYTSTYTIRTTLDQQIISASTLPTKHIYLNRPSIVNSSGHTWEYSGSGTDYNALPQNGGQTVISSQQVAEFAGRVYTSGTNELGDFTVGNFITAYNRTGNIVFANKVTVSELSALKLSLSDITINAISSDVGLGDNESGGPLNSRLSTQLAIRSFFANRLGDFIDKNVSTNSIPSAIVQLNSNGQINSDLLPVIRGSSTHLVSGYGGRLSLFEKIPADEVLAGDIISETYNEVELILSGNITLLAGSVVTQATSGAYGTLKTDVTLGNDIKLVFTSGTFDTSHTLSSGSSLGVYPTSVLPNQATDNYYLNNSNTSQLLQLKVTDNYRFTIGNSVSAAVNGAQGTITDYRSGFITGLGALVQGSGYTPLGSTATYLNVPLTGGTGKYTSAAGATSSDTTITVTSTTGLEIGMLVTVTAGTGAFYAGTTVTNISSATQFTVSHSLTTPLSGGSTVVRGDATGAYADITISSGKVTSVNMYRGGVGYQTGDLLSASASNIGGSVVGAFSIAVGNIEKRLYIDITNGVKFTPTATANDYIEDNNASNFTVTLTSSLSKSFNAGSSGAGGDVNYVTNRITIPNHGFTDGDPLNYNSGINVAIGNLTSGNTYYAGVVDINTIELYFDYSKVILQTLGTSSTGTHTLTRNAVDTASNHIVKVDHGLTTGQAVRLSNFTGTAPLANINGSVVYIPNNSFYFVGSVTTNSFTLHQYQADTIISVNGFTHDPIDFINTGSGNVTFTVENVAVVGQINTSSKTANNYSILTTSAIDTSNIISGIVSTTRLGSGTANSSTYLRGDSAWHTAVESISTAPNSPISIASNYNSGSLTIPSITGSITSTATLTTVTGISSTSQLFAGMILTKTSGSPGAFGGTTTILSVDSPTQISITSTTANTVGSLTFTASSALNQFYGNATFDIVRIDNATSGSGTYSNTGVASFDKTFFTIGTKATSGQVTITNNTVNAATLGPSAWGPSYFLDSTNHTTQPVNLGGTGFSAYTTGDMIYANSSSTLSKLGIGVGNRILTSSGTAPQWSNTLTLDGNISSSSSSTGTLIISSSGGLGVGGNVYIGNNLSVVGTSNFNDLTVAGNLTVNGTTTTVNSNTVSVDDKNIELGNVPSATISTTGTIGSITGSLLQGSTTFTASGTSVTAAATYTGKTQSATNGSGSGAVFTIQKTGSGTAYSGFITVTITTSGTGYAIGNTITIPGTSLGGTSPANDLILTVASALGSPWTPTITGMTTTSGLIIGSALTATSGTGTLYGGSPTSVLVTSILSSTSLTYTVTGGTTPTAGTVTNILTTGFTDITANGGGITLKGTTDKTINWSSSTSAWTSSENIDLASGKNYLLNGTNILSSVTYVGTTSVALNRASANLALTGITSVTFPGSSSGTATLQATAVAGTPTLSLPATTGTLVGTGDSGTVSNTMLANSSFYIGTTSISLGRASASISLTGVSIDGSAGKATNLIGGNATTLLGSMPYQSNTDTTTLLSPNTTSTKKFLRMTGTGTNGAAPAWDTIVAGDIPTLNQDTTGTASKATNLVGGNATTLLGSIPYQSNTDTTTLLAPNTTATKKFLVETGTGTNGAAPSWATIIAGDIPTLNQNTTGSAGSVANSLTIGTGLSGSSYNGSAAVTIALATGYGDTLNPYASKTANYVLAAPNGTSGAPTFRAIVAADIPTLNQNTAGNAATATKLAATKNINGVPFDGSADITISSASSNTLTIGTGLSGTSYNGSSAVTIALATGYGDTLNPYASKTANYFLAAPNGSAGVPTFRTIAAADIPTLNQNTTGSAATLTTSRNINGVAFNGSADITVTAAASTLTGNILASGVTSSSLTSLGTLTSLTVTNNTTGNWTSTINSGTLGGTSGNQVLMQKLASSDANGNSLEITEVRDSAGTSWISAGTRIQEKIDSTWMGFIQFNGTNNPSGITFGTGTSTVSATSIPERVRIDSSGNMFPVVTNTQTLGTSSLKWSTIYGTATSAQYADLAEKYTADAVYEPGTVVDFGGDKEVTLSIRDMSRKIAGIVSTDPAYLMNSDLESEFVVTVALTGRVPCKVQGTVRKGDMMVSAGNGYARAEEDPKLGSVIGKALEDFDGDTGVIEVVVGRL